MDTFMDKLMQKRTAQGMIEANSAADAAKMEMLQRQVTEYELLLQEMRKVNVKTAENTEQMEKAIQASFQKIEAFQADNSTQAATEEFLTEMRKQIEESFHKECVKVYRNVQASTVEEMNKQTNALAAKQQESGKNQKVLLPISIITMLLVAADILIHLFNIVLPL
ncbi:MAG: hypothetical protein NC321_04965 [Clostridium sp.]|nr:hypothetical protein [Clostridium sp.]